MGRPKGSKNKKEIEEIPVGKTVEIPAPEVNGVKDLNPCGNCEESSDTAS